MKTSQPTERRVISLKTFFNLHKKAQSYDEVTRLLNRLRRDSREKYEECYKEAGDMTSRTGRRAAVFIVGERSDMGGKMVYRFRTMDIDGLNSTMLAEFVEQLGDYQLIRSTIRF